MGPINYINSFEGGHVSFSDTFRTRDVLPTLINSREVTADERPIVDEFVQRIHDWHAWLRTRWTPGFGNDQPPE